MDELMRKQTEDDQLLISRLIALGRKGDRDAFLGAFEIMKDLEKRGSERIVTGVRYKQVTMHYDEDCFRIAHSYTADMRGYVAESAPNDSTGKLFKLYENLLLFDAPWDFDCFCRYIEWNREQSKRFYMPRRKQLLPLARAMQDLAERKIHLLCISTPPGVGKTTLAEFFLAWIGGRNPELPNIIGSHSNSFLRGMYDEMGRILNKRSEYLWHNVFPDVSVSGTNAKDLMLDLGSRKRFSTYEFSSVGSGNAGKIRAQNLLYVDDLVDGIETALSRDRLDKLWQQYYTDYRQRKQGDCVELLIGTRWSVHDVIGRLEDMYGESPDAKFIVCPALNEQDESNFDYPYGLGFTTEFYREQREIMDQPSWSALYQGIALEREGQLYPVDQLQRYFELPEGDPDAIIGVCDTKTTGSDYCVMPIAYQYGQKFYIEDVLCENYAPQVVEPNLVTKICKHNPHYVRFESNVAGGKLAADIQQAVKEKDCRTKIETKWTQSNKETKILMEAPWVIDHCIFKDDSIIHGEEWREYRKMIQMLCSYSLEGKNKHDDVPDAFAQLSQFAQSFGGNKLHIVKRVF